MDSRIQETNILYLILCVNHLKKIVSDQNKEIKRLNEFVDYCSWTILQIKEECKKYNIKPLLKLKGQLIDEIMHWATIIFLVLMTITFLAGVAGFLWGML